MKIEDFKKEDCFVKIRHEIKEFKVKYRNAIGLVNELKNIPKKGEAIYIWMQGNFIFGDFIVQYITENDLTVDELTIITLSISNETISALIALINEGWTKKINFMVSEYFIRTEKIKHTKSIMLLETATKENENFKVFYSNTHQKVTLMKLEDGNKIIMHGSANMKGSQNFEQLMIDNNDKLYDFNYQYFNNLILKQNGKIR
jgi:hypothetical protein